MIDINIQDKLHKRYNPEGSLLRHDQLIRVEVLKHFSDICEKNNIKWWICSGTLLGAVRHGGFVPWDDDIDIAMFTEEFKKLEKVLKKENSDKYFYQSFKTDPNYVALFSKYRLKEGKITLRHPRTQQYKYLGLGFDIFIMQRTSLYAAKLSAPIYKKIVGSCYKINNPKIREFCTAIAVRVARFIVKSLHILFLPFKKKGEFHFACGTGWPRVTFDEKYIYPLKRIPFEGNMFPVPHDYDSYLKCSYGDYMKLPSEEQIKKRIHAKEYRIEIFGEE